MSGGVPQDTARDCRGEFRERLAMWQREADRQHDVLIARHRLAADAMEELWRQALATKKVGRPPAQSPLLSPSPSQPARANEARS